MFKIPLESINNLTPPLSSLHFTVQQSPIQQNPALNSNDIITTNPKPVDKTLQNTLHPGVSLAYINKNRENKMQSFNNTTHDIKVTDTSVLHNKPTDNLLLLNHNPSRVENNSLFQNTLNVPHREENYAKRSTY
jgi:hypothetical protein